MFHSEGDVAHLKPPNATDYEVWTSAFLGESARRLGLKVNILSEPGLQQRIARVLRIQFEQTPESERLLRNWTKMAGFPAAVLLSQAGSIAGNELVAIVENAAREISGEHLPWDD